VKRADSLVLVTAAGAWLALAPISAPCAESGTTVTSHGLTLFSELKYGPDFRHFDYVNPDAPKGGTFTYAWSNAFDSLNPFIAVGTPAVGIAFVIYDSLMVRSGDEPASVYGLLAESITLPDDYSWAEFRLRDEARWHDGRPVTVDDVIFSLQTLQTKASPQFRYDYAEIDRVEAIGPGTVRFTFTTPGNRGNAYTVAQMPVLPKHYWQHREFDRPTLEPPLTSGPYRVAQVDPGRSYTLQRVADYWGRDLPVNRGRYNFDVMRHDFYRDLAVQFEAFMAGKFDLRWETLPNQWATGYNTQAVRDGRVIKELLEFEGPTFYSGFYFNLRRDKFSDRRVREAIVHAFDFEWINRNIFHDLYVRLRGPFGRTELGNTGLPEGLELEYLEPFRDQLDPRIFTQDFRLPETDATQASLRENLRIAAGLFREAGWTMQNGRLVSPKGEPMQIEILLWDPFWERVTASFIANLKLLGIDARMRLIDTTEWARRMQNFQFEMSQGFLLPQPLSPGIEQREIWGSASVDQPGSRNQMGIRNPVIDALVERIIAAPDRESQVAATRALDRVICWNYYMVPLYYAPGIPIAYWNRFGRPELEPKWLRMIWHMSTWWIDPEKDAALKKGSR
jgi:microcin C transport system substrate-binding protein